MEDIRTCVIAGGGPAGIMLGLLLARAGVEVTVLEKHSDFLRDFRGDTVHPSTQELLAELGLTDAFDGVVRGRITRLRIGTPSQVLLDADISKASPSAAFHDIAMAPQWDLLNLLVQHGRRYPGFDLRMNAEALRPLYRRGAVAGVRYRDVDGEHELRAVLTVGADGRDSALREATGSDLIDLGAPMDVLWFRLARTDADGAGLRGMIGTGELAAMIDRGDYWQVAYLIAKGSHARVVSEGIERFRSRIAALTGFSAERVNEVGSFDDVRVLRVGLNRMRRWFAPGFLAIGDAAHTMSPIGGVGINLAIQDAVAAANLLAAPLLLAQDDPARISRVLNPAILRRVQRRRQFPTAVTQRIQQLAQRTVIDRALRSREEFRVPRLVSALTGRPGPISALFVRVLAYGVLPEHVHTPDAYDPDLSAPERYSARMR